LWVWLSLAGYTVEYRDVSGYTVEKKRKGQGNWQKASASPTPDNRFTVPGLQEGSVWEFRVVAVNDAGEGKPSKTTAPHTVRDPVCKFVYSLSCGGFTISFCF